MTTAFSEDWLIEHNARMARLRAASAVAPAGPASREGATILSSGCGSTSPQPMPASVTAGGEAVEGTRSPQTSKAKRRHPEQDLHIAAVKFLNVALPPTWRVVHVANGVAGGDHSALVANQFRKAMGVRAGFPDLEMIGPGRFVVAEAKAGKGRLSPEQEEWRDWFQSIGVPWFVFRSHDELVAGCIDAGVPLRVRTA